MSILWKLILSVVIGLLAYGLSKLAPDGGLPLRATTRELSLLLIFIGAVFAGSMVPGWASLRPDRETGTVKWFNVRKGYGFITRDQGDDIFVHFRNIRGEDRRAISEGQRVSFIVTTGDKGPQAEKVTPTDDEQP